MRIGRVFGVNIVIDVSWLFVFALVSWALSSSAGPFHAVNVTPVTRTILATVTALLFFASVLIHELAHSLVAKAQGIPVQEIRLFIFGGASKLTGEPASPPSAALVALAGPLTSIVLALLCGLAAFGAGMTTPAGVVLAYLATANTIVGVFNLLPAYPMDGGRVLQAILWGFTHDRVRATKTAGQIGVFFAWLLIGYGVFDAFVPSFGAGIWFMLIGWFLLLSAKGEWRQVELQAALHGHTAIQLAVPAAETVAADALAESALKLMLAKGVRAMPVMLGERFIGLVTLADFATIDAEALAHTYVTALMKRTEDLTTIAPDGQADEALLTLGKTGFHQLPVVDAEGTFLGFVTREGVIEWLAHQRGPQGQSTAVHQP
jgi:Zn-dependent protease/CBS domain-containing protein